MVGIDIFEAVPLIIWTEVPALGILNFIRLPHIKEPRVRFSPQFFDLFTKAHRTLYRGVNQGASGIAFHHRSGGFGGGHDPVMRRG